jgi:hypothetical protein
LARGAGFGSIRAALIKRAKIPLPAAQGAPTRRWPVGSAARARWSSCGGSAIPRPAWTVWATPRRGQPQTIRADRRTEILAAAHLATRAPGVTS